MSAQYRDMPRWAKNALRENEIKLFTRLQACAVLAERFVEYSKQHFDAQDAAIAAGANEVEVRFGLRMGDAKGTVPNGDCPQSGLMCRAYILGRFMSWACAR